MDVLNSLDVIKKCKQNINKLKDDIANRLDEIAPIESDVVVQALQNVLEEYENQLKFDEWMVTTTYPTTHLYGYSFEEINIQLKKLRLHQSYIEPWGQVKL